MGTCWAAETDTWQLTCEIFVDKYSRERSHLKWFCLQNHEWELFYIYWNLYTIAPISSSSFFFSHCACRFSIAFLLKPMKKKQQQKGEKRKVENKTKKCNCGMHGDNFLVNLAWWSSPVYSTFVSHSEWFGPFKVTVRQKKKTYKFIK